MPSDRELGAYLGGLITNKKAISIQKHCVPAIQYLFYDHFARSLMWYAI